MFALTAMAQDELAQYAKEDETKGMCYNNH